MRNFLQRNWYIFLLSLIGVIGGYVYWRFVGCTAGSCPITANWHTSTIAGGVLGYLLSGTIADFRKKRGT